MDKVRFSAKLTLYVLLSLLFYIFMTSMHFTRPPFLLIPLCIAISIFESESKLAISLFGAWSGILCDMAMNKLLGFTSIILMISCLACSLLVTHLIRPNFFNHFVLSISATAIVMFSDFFFGHYIWGHDNTFIIAKTITIPVIIFTGILSPVVFWIIKKISLGIEPKYNPTPEEDLDEWHK